MTARGGAVLYTPDILTLAVTLADYPLAGDWPLTGEAHSRVCGSRVRIGLTLDERGRIARVGAVVTACAIGQAAAALFLTGAAGHDGAALAEAQAGLEAWLAGEGAMPDWPGIAALDPARAYPARHAAIVLPWRAARTALSNRAGGD